MTLPATARGIYRFHFDRGAQAKATPGAPQLDRLAALDGFTCFVHGDHPGLDPAGLGNVWAGFAGAHDLGFEAPENYAPIAMGQLGPWSSDEVVERNEERQESAHELNMQLYGATGPVDDAVQQVDLGSLRGMAGIILPGPGALYNWTSDGVSIRWKSLQGTWIPLDGAAAKQLHIWGDNIYTNDCELDCELIDGLLDQALAGWKVDRTICRASCEAAVWLTCERDVLTASAGSEIFEVADTDERDKQAWTRAEWLRSPLADENASYQTKLVGRRAVLVWGNSD
jgi:hypothetical protein